MKEIMLLTKNGRGLNKSYMNSMNVLRLSSKKRGDDGKTMCSMRAQRLKVY